MRYYANGFTPISEPPARRALHAAVVDIKKGDALHDNAAGRPTNATTSFAATFLGIAAAPCDNTPEASLEAEFYPLDFTARYIVPVGDSLIAETNKGTYCNLNSTCNTLAIGTNPTEGVAFFVEDIDVSADALVGNAYGYAIGRFRVVGTQA